MSASGTVILAMTVSALVFLLSGQDLPGILGNIKPVRARKKS